MKEINTYILEKLKISSRSKIDNNVWDTETIEFPLKLDFDNISKKQIWKKAKVPYAKYVIYLDYYRGLRAHLAAIEDFLFQVVLFQEDYEDFNFDKDILYASDDEHDIASWFIKDYLKLEDPDRYEDEYDWERTIKRNPKIVDSNTFLFNLYKGEDQIWNVSNFLGLSAAEKRKWLINQLVELGFCEK